MSRTPTLQPLALALLLLPASLFAGDLRTPAIFGHNMVLQQQKTLPV